MQRGRVSVSDGDNPSGSVAGIGDFTTEVLKGPGGTPTTVTGAMYGFAPRYKVGKSSGRLEVFGTSYDASYAETGDFEYSTDVGAEAIHPRA